MEKDQPDSMTTVAIKPEYPPSEYSGSEPPPAYRRPMSSAVQIARIAAYTIVASCLILGTFILASSWVHARAGCQQLEHLDAILEKELALEGRAYGNDALVPDEPLPIGNAHALHGAPPSPATSPAPVDKKPAAVIDDATQTDDALNQAETKVNEDKLQKLDDDKDDSPGEDSSDESDSSDSEEDDLDGGRGSVLRLPIQFDLDDIAGAFLAENNQKGRMNCVVERRREEAVEKRFPFNLLGAFGPKAEPTERIALICHVGDDKPEFPEPAAQVFAFPLSGPPRMPVRPLPPVGLQPPAPAQPMHRAAPFPMPMPWDLSSEDASPPREMRIHVQRIIAIPSRNLPGPPEPNMIPFSRQDDGPFPRDMRTNDYPFPRTHEMIFPRDMPIPRPQEIPSNRPMGPFQRPQEMPMRDHDMPMHPHDMPMRPYDIQMRPQEIPMRPNDIQMRPQEMPMRPQEMPMRPQEIPMRAIEIAMRSQDMPMRPQEMPMRPQEMPMRPQEMPMRPQEMPMLPQDQRPHILISPFSRDNTISFPQQQQPADQPQGEQNESTVMHQFVPQTQQPIQEIGNPEKVDVESMGVPLALPWGLTPETIRAIHRHAVESDRQQEESDAEQQQMDSDMQEVKTIVNTLTAAAAAEVEGAASRAQEQDNSSQSQDQPQEQQVHLDSPVIIQQESAAEDQQRPHYVQPRSIRSVEALLRREKRVKRSAFNRE